MSRLRKLKLPEKSTTCVSLMEREASGLTLMSVSNLANSQRLPDAEPGGGAASSPMIEAGQ